MARINQEVFLDTNQQRRLRIDLGISLALIAIFSFVYINIDKWVITNLPFTISPADFPRLVTGILIAISGLLGVISFCALSSLKRRQNGKVHVGDCDLACECEEGLSSRQLMSLGLYIGILLLYIVGLNYIGFVYSTPIAMFLIAKILGLKKWIIGMICYIIFVVTLNYFVFEFMHVILPTGTLFE